MERTRFFHYRQGNSFLHRMAASLKIILMVVLAIGAFYVPPLAGIALWLLLIISSLALLGFHIQEVLCDQKPALAYLVMIYLASLILHITGFIQSGLPPSPHTIAGLFLPDGAYLPLFAHLGLSLEISSLFYRTTSTMQFHEGFAAIERALTRRKQTPFADLLALTITFIPRIASFWQQIDTAWQARGGKKSIFRITSLIPVLFRVSLREAYGKALARQNRS